MELTIPYPKTMVVVITAHGNISIDTTYSGRKEPDIFAIPYGMTLSRINAVAPGICNYLSPVIANNIVESTKEMTRMYDLSNKTSISPSLIKLLSREFKRLTNEDWKTDTRIDYSDADAAVDADADAESNFLKMYKTHYDKAYSTSMHNEYSFAINKIYTIHNLSEDYDNNILFLNTPQGEIEYFHSIQPPYATDLKSIVFMLAELGVKNILLIDLSCAKFNDPSLTPRDERSIRRETVQERWGGKHVSKNIRSKKIRSKSRSKNIRSKKISKKICKKISKSKHKLKHKHKHTRKHTRKLKNN